MCVRVWLLAGSLALPPLLLFVDECHAIPLVCSCAEAVRGSVCVCDANRVPVTQLLCCSPKSLICFLDRAPFPKHTQTPQGVPLFPSSKHFFPPHTCPVLLFYFDFRLLLAASPLPCVAPRASAAAAAVQIEMNKQRGGFMLCCENRGTENESQGEQLRDNPFGQRYFSGRTLLCCKRRARTIVVRHLSDTQAQRHQHQQSATRQTQAQAGRQ